MYTRNDHIFCWEARSARQSTFQLEKKKKIEMAGKRWGDINALPEDCLEKMLAMTSPKDAGKLSAVSSMFHNASQSDAVWGHFLPREILSRAVDGHSSILEKFRSNKDLYLHLCDHPILIDEGRLSFSLEKKSGKKCYMLSARELHITWADTPQYWEWVFDSESRFAEKAKLLSVCWFEIRGKINLNMLSSGTNYAAYLVYDTDSSVNGFGLPAEGSVAITGEESEKRMIYLNPEEQGQIQVFTPRYRSFIHRRSAPVETFAANTPSGSNISSPIKRDDGLLEVELGEHFVRGGEIGDLEMSLMEVKGRNWKRGLVIEGIEIRPKEKGSN